MAMRLEAISVLALEVNLCEVREDVLYGCTSCRTVLMVGLSGTSR